MPGSGILSRLRSSWRVFRGRKRKARPLRLGRLGPWRNFSLTKSLENIFRRKWFLKDQNWEGLKSGGDLFGMRSAFSLVDVIIVFIVPEYYQLISVM